MAYINNVMLVLHHYYQLQGARQIFTTDLPKFITPKYAAEMRAFETNINK